MPRDGSGVYSKPANTTPSANDTIESAKFNTLMDDIANDLNTDRPVVAGGTGGSTEIAALDNLFAKSGNIASATTTNLASATGTYVTVTGTTTITGFGTVAAGAVRILRFSGVLTLTHNGTSLILPTGANIVTVAGDTGIFVSEGSGNWRCVGGTIAGVQQTNIVDDTTPQLGGDLDANGNQIKWAKGADVASATALPVLTDGNYFDVTGTTTITSINTCGGDGTIAPIIKLHFDGALTLTHHATNLVLPGGANITTAAGDEAEFVEYGVGDWRCTNFTRVDGTAVVVTQARALIATATASNDATIEFTGLSSAYARYIVEMLNVHPATDGDHFRMRTSTNNGTSFDSGSSDYAWSAFNSESDDTTSTSGNTSDSAIKLNRRAIGSAAGEDVGGIVSVINPSNASFVKIIFDVGHDRDSGTLCRIIGGGKRKASADVDAIQFYFASGNIASGIFKLYGIV